MDLNQFFKPTGVLVLFNMLKVKASLKYKFWGMHACWVSEIQLERDCHLSFCAFCLPTEEKNNDLIE